MGGIEEQIFANVLGQFIAAIVTGIVVAIVLPLFLILFGKHIRTLQYSFLKKYTTWRAGPEVVACILNPGESLPIDDIKIQLDDIAPSDGLIKQPSALLSVLDNRGNILVREEFFLGYSSLKVPNGRTYHIAILDIKSGFSNGTKYVDIGVRTGKKIGNKKNSKTFLKFCCF